MLRYMVKLKYNKILDSNCENWLKDRNGPLQWRDEGKSLKKIWSWAMRTINISIRNIKFIQVGGTKNVEKKITLVKVVKTNMSIKGVTKAMIFG